MIGRTYNTVVQPGCESVYTGCVLAVGGCMLSTCLILVPVVTTGCTTVNKTVYTLQPVVPCCANRLGRRRFSVAAPRVWNTLPLVALV